MCICHRLVHNWLNGLYLWYSMCLWYAIYLLCLPSIVLHHGCGNSRSGNHCSSPHPTRLHVYKVSPSDILWYFHQRLCGNTTFNNYILYLPSRTTRFIGVWNKLSWEMFYSLSDILYISSVDEFTHHEFTHHEFTHQHCGYICLNVNRVFKSAKHDIHNIHLLEYLLSEMSTISKPLLLNKDSHNYHFKRSDW